MATVLSISSQVVRGYVGNSASAFTLQRLGHEVWALPTVLASNHLGYERVRGEYTPAVLLYEILDVIEANGWLGEVGAVLTGYLPSADHVDFAAETIARVRARTPEAVVLCDPVLGDLPGGLYVDERAAETFRYRLLPLADVTTPNVFELAWLARAKTDGEALAVAAARTLGPETVIVTSVPAAKHVLGNLLVKGRNIAKTEVTRRHNVPNGTGDLFAALILSHLLNGADPQSALACATAGVDAALAASEGADELRLLQTQEAWANCEPWRVLPVVA